jgi:hypothetical protein
MFQARTKTSMLRISRRDHAGLHARHDYSALAEAGGPWGVGIQAME